MIDITDKIPFAGATDSRAAEAIKVLKELRFSVGQFQHNDTILTVYPDSTVREICWQYEAKRKHR